MDANKHELRLLAAVACVAPFGEPVHKHFLAGVFDRPSKLDAVIDSLRISGVITFDSYQGVMRVLPDRVWQVVNQFAVTPELFTDQQPLDAVLVEVCRKNLAALLNHTAPREITQAAPVAISPPVPVGPDPPIVDVMPVKHADHATHAMPPAGPKTCPTPMQLSARLYRACLSCKGIEQKTLHDRHEVGELEKRSTAELLDDILALVPSISNDFLLSWYERIVREDAELVNAAVRELRLQRRHIGNPGGFLNSLYLKAIK